MNLTLEYESFQDFASKLWPSLSEEGMWIRSENPAGVGELVDFDVMLADGFRLFHGTGQVIGVGSGPEGGAGGEGMTLRFSQLDQPSRNLVRKVVSKHIGEGGKLFVLSTPGTKVEVVGDDEAQGPPDGTGRGEMGPEDLVAPFAGLETDTPWSGDAEPELTSFLRPSGRAADLEGGADATKDDAAPFEPPESSVEPIFKAPEAEAEPGFSSGPREDEDIPHEDVSAAPGDSPGTEPWNPPTDSAPDLSREFELGLAETQRVEPEDLVETGQRDLPMASDAATFSPMPSTVIPPSSPGFEEDGEAGDEGPPTDEFYPHGTSASNGRAVWPWVVVGGLAVGASLYALWQMDTPLSSMFGKGAEAEQVTSTTVESGEPGSTGLQAGEAVETDGDSPLEVTGEMTASAGELEEDAAEATAAAGPRPTAPAGESTSGEATTGPDARVDTSAARPATPSEAIADVAPPSEEQPPATDTPAGPALEPLSLQRITWREEEDDTVIRLALSGPIDDDRFETQRVSGGSPRVVLKMLGARGNVPRGPVAIGSDHVQQLRFGIHDVAGGRQIHAVADLAEESVQLVGSVVISDGAVELRFSRP